MNLENNIKNTPPQIYRVSEILNKKPIAKSSEHKNENTSKTTTISKKLIENKYLVSSFGINNNSYNQRNPFEHDKSLTIPNENSLRDEKLDNKISKNIIQFAKSNPSSNKLISEPNKTTINKANNAKLEKIFMFSDSFSKYSLLGGEKEKKNTQKKEILQQENSKNQSSDSQTSNKLPIYSSSINTVKNFLQNKEKKTVAQSNEKEKKQQIVDEMKKNFEIQSIKKQAGYSYNLSQSNKKNESPLHKEENLLDSLSERNIDYYLKNGIFQNLKIEKSDLHYLYEILEKNEFSFYICDAIKEQRDELKLFLTPSNTRYKTSKRILILTNCEIKFNFYLFLFF